MEPVKNKLQNLMIYIIGTTAAGKTKLSLTLGKQLNGEIISCDSMQIYKKVDIMTAKATQKEQSIVKHHMLDALELNELNFNRNEYFFKSNEIANKIKEQNKIPIIVGGTHYYIETLLFNQKIAQTNEKQNLDEKKIKLLDEIENMTPEQRFAKLQELDPLLSKKIHQNNAKRVKQYLSLIIENDFEPLSSKMEDHMKVPLRNENCLVFWPRCSDNQKLKAQQLKRIKEMVQEGGLTETMFIIDELIGNQISQIFQQQNNTITQEQEQKLLFAGVLQSIGYKEFMPIYKHFKINHPQLFSPSYQQNLDYQKSEFYKIVQDNQELTTLLEQCIEQLHLNTYHMAKKQIQWIKNRIITNSDSEQISKRLITLDFDEFTSENFDQMAVQPALQISNNYIKNIQEGKSPQESIELVYNSELNKYFVKQSEIQQIKDSQFDKSLEKWENFFCEYCFIDIHGQKEQEIHLKSKKHKGKLKFIETLNKIDKNTKQYEIMSKKHEEFKKTMMEQYLKDKNLTLEEFNKNLQIQQQQQQNNDKNNNNN